jgi:ribosomal protein S18 acetylase RimI-like enzyme
MKIQHKIRKAQLSDISQLVILFDAYRVFYQKTSDVNGAEQFLLERLKQKNSVLFVCETSKSKLIGFVQLYPLFSSTKMKKFWLLNDLYVDSNYRGQRISAELIAQAKLLVRETKACGKFFEAEKSNTIGNSLY